MWFLSRKHKLAYLQVPKSACTTIRFILLELERPGLVSDFLSKHNSVPSMRDSYDFFQQHCELIEPSLALPHDARDFFRFSFVRDPLERCLSAYWNKICFVPPNKLRKDNEYLNNINDIFFSQHYKKFGFEKFMLFEQFVDILSSQEKDGMDSHLVSQRSIIHYEGQYQTDFVGRVERFSDDILKIISCLPNNILEFRFNKARKASSSGVEINMETYNKLLNYYEDDFHLLRYIPKVPEGMVVTAPP